MELITLPLIKSALPVSIPGFTLSNLKITGHNFLTNISSVTLSAVGCTGYAHHNGPFLKQTIHELHSAEFFMISEKCYIIFITPRLKIQTSKNQSLSID